MRFFCKKTFLNYKKYLYGVNVESLRTTITQNAKEDAQRLYDIFFNIIRLSKNKRKPQQALYMLEQSFHKSITDVVDGDTFECSTPLRHE